MLIEEPFAGAMLTARGWQFVHNPDAVGPCLPDSLGIEVDRDNLDKALLEIWLGTIGTKYSVDTWPVAECQPTFASPPITSEIFEQTVRAYREAA